MWQYLFGLVIGYCSFKISYKFNTLRLQLEQTSNENKGFVNSSLAVFKFIKSLMYDTYYRKRYGLIKYNPSLFDLYKIKSLQYTKVYIGSNIYHIPVIQKKGPQQYPIVNKIIGLGIEYHVTYDVTDIIMPFLGPQNDFFGMNVKCETFGFSNLTFINEDISYTFKTGENIDLQKLIPLYSENTEVITF